MSQLVSLSELCKMQSGGTPSRKNLDFYTGTIPWAKISDLEKSNDGYIYETEEHITEEALKLINNRIFSPNTLLLAMYGSVGKTAITRIQLSTNQAILGINIKEADKLDIKYLRYWLLTIKESLLNRAVGAALQNISLGIVKELQIPLPPLEQQKRIAAILDAADAYRQKTKALIAKYDELTQSLFLDMFGDPVKNEKGWEVKKLGSITNMKAGKFIAASEIYSENSSQLQPCFGGNGLRGYVNSHTHEGEFVLIGRQGALCGNVKITSGKFHATEHAIVCSPEVQYNTLWLYYLLKLMNLNRFSTGAAQPGLNVGTLVDLEVFFVPNNLQNQFAERVQAIEEQKAQAQTSLEKAEELFNSLLQRAFKGELV